MTTVAVSKYQIAADRKASSANGHFDIGTKMRHFHIEGYYPLPFTIGYCGDVDHIIQVMNFFDNPVDWQAPKKLNRADFVMLTADHKMFTFSHPLRLMPIHNKFYAIGSGSNFAMGAMQFGATPYEAVKAACKLDNFTGYKVEKKDYE